MIMPQIKAKADSAPLSLINVLITYRMWARIPFAEKINSGLSSVNFSIPNNSCRKGASMASDTIENTMDKTMKRK